ncbi:MAG TPA: UvrD-helicase domain-containing protein [Gemmatimonadaceae bacterium]
MTAPGTPRAPAPEADDQPARDRILRDLDTNMLVEAGAGSGKTTSLVGRMLALVTRGTPVEHIAAVTFTRKAANELRERFQMGLERGAREDVGGERGRLCERALRELDRAFLGTIHSFCARLLREHPLEVGIDPGFREVTDEDWTELRRDFWRRWVERARRTDDPIIHSLHRVGLDTRDLEQGFEGIVAYPDVNFPLVDSGAPDPAPCRRALEALLGRARSLLPADEPDGGWDDLMRLVRRLDRRRRVDDWGDPAKLCAALEGVTAAQCALVQKRWSAEKEGKADAKRLGEELRALVDGPIAELLRRWREHRYPVVMRVLQRAAREFEAERRATGQLGFEDLLLLTAALLREQPRVRDELGARWAHLLVDEFQDTDPIQAEVCFLLASGSAQGADWRTVTPRPGALFVVGDPKQSIYRFRRADIQTYEHVKQRLEACGVVLALTRNFRSARPIERLVNDHFAGVFPERASAVQASFTPMRVVRDGTSSAGVFRYEVRPDGGRKDAIVEADATRVASWIAERVDGGRSAGEFLVLTATKKWIEAYARALAERNVPVTTTGARLPRERELTELLVALRAIADPENAVAVAAALEGLFFGLSPADLFDARQARVRFGITHPPAGDALPAERALLRLHEWWMVSQRHPADVLLERILDDTGLLFHAASQPLGDARAGALLHLVEVLRGASLAGASGITDAMERIELELEGEAADAPLRPGRADAVRVMNLHKAKGLEAEVVILAAPVDADPPLPDVCIRRGEHGGTGARAEGWLAIARERVGNASPVVIAQPPDWDDIQERERRFASAERDRLLYVAVTRAKEELVVSRCVRERKSGAVPDASTWSPLAATLDTLATPIELPVVPAPGRRRVAREAGDIARAVSDADARVRAAAAPTVRITTVTESAKEARFERRAYDVPEQGTGAGTGAAWGRAVHRSIEALGRGRRGDALHAFVAAVARDEGLEAEQRERLASLLGEVERSGAWRRLTAHGAPRIELPVMRCISESGQERIVEGVIDAAALGEDGWLVVDWKSDDVTDDVWRERAAQYGRQVAAYVEMLSALTGREAKGVVERVRLDGGR